MLYQKEFTSWGQQQHQWRNYLFFHLFLEKMHPAQIFPWFHTYWHILWHIIIFSSWNESIHSPFHLPQVSSIFTTFKRIFTKLTENHKLWAAVHMHLYKLKKAKHKNRHTCSHITQSQLMAYSDGTSGCRPNICTHDLSCFPQGQSIEKYSDIIVCACVCGPALSLFYKLVFTPTPNHQRLNRITE